MSQAAKATSTNPSRPTLTLQRLRELLSYEPETGVFTFKVSRGNIRVGARAGSVNHDGYTRITIDHRRYLAHRLAWLYVHGKWPPEEIDHRDGDPSNNQFSNLREASHAQNRWNASTRNQTGLKGVSYKPFVRYFSGGPLVPRAKAFAAVIKVGNRQKTLGHFATAEEAHEAYWARAQELFGEFARKK